MAIYIETTRPRTLIRAIREKIEQDEIATWAYDEDGDFTHTALQWKYKAWLRPYIKNERKCYIGDCASSKQDCYHRNLLHLYGKVCRIINKALLYVYRENAFKSYTKFCLR